MEELKLHSAEPNYENFAPCKKLKATILQILSLTEFSMLLKEKRDEGSNLTTR
jgi:hypothetical protein